MTTKEVRRAFNVVGVYVSTLSQRDGVFTVRKEYFYRHGYDEDKFAAAVLKAIPCAVIVDKGDHWAAFRGNASTARSSHWWVKFRIAEHDANV